jgi:hypothetical protein
MAPSGMSYSETTYSHLQTQDSGRGVQDCRQRFRVSQSKPCAQDPRALDAQQSTLQTSSCSMTSLTSYREPVNTSLPPSIHS